MAERRVHRGVMRDQRIEPRATLGLENPCHRLGVRRIAAQAIDRLGAESDQRAGSQQRRRACHACGIGGQHLCRNDFCHSVPVTESHNRTYRAKASQDSSYRSGCTAADLTAAVTTGMKYRPDPACVASPDA